MVSCSYRQEHGLSECTMRAFGQSEPWSFSITCDKDALSPPFNPYSTPGQPEVLGSRITSLGNHADDNSPLTLYWQEQLLISFRDFEVVDILYWDKKFDQSHFEAIWLQRRLLNFIVLYFYLPIVVWKKEHKHMIAF